MQISKPDFMSLQAKLTSLERRVDRLETLQCVGRMASEAVMVRSLYIDAALGHIGLSQNDATLWANTVKQMDEEDLLYLAKEMTDPFPWRPFLLVLDFYADAGYDTMGMNDYLLGMAQNFLRFQGLSKLRPEDVLEYSYLHGLSEG